MASTLAQKGLKMVTMEEAQGRSKDIQALGYYECSALTQEGLKNVFDECIRAAINNQNKKKNNGGGCCIIL
jgi:hypothetical protein